MKELRTGAFLGTACLLAGIGPFVVPGRGVQRAAVAAAFCLPAMLPIFTSDRSLGLAFVAVAIGLVSLGSIAGVWLVDSMELRRALLVRNLQFASAGAVCAALVSGILWARDLIRSDVSA